MDCKRLVHSNAVSTKIRKIVAVNLKKIKKYYPNQRNSYYTSHGN